MEGAFSQPNGQVCAKMLGWALDVTRGSEGDLLELYCGNANFTVPLAQNFRHGSNLLRVRCPQPATKPFELLLGHRCRRVLATEISKSSVTAAQYNIEARP